MPGLMTRINYYAYRDFTQCLAALKKIKGVKDQSEAVGIIIIRNNSKIIHAS